MVYYEPKPAEISVIEQIETVETDPTLTETARSRLMCKLWRKMERIHGNKIESITSPDDHIIYRPAYFIDEE